MFCEHVICLKLVQYLFLCIFIFYYNTEIAKARRQQMGGESSSDEEEEDEGGNDSSNISGSSDEDYISFQQDNAPYIFSNNKKRNIPLYFNYK